MNRWKLLSKRWTLVWGVTVFVGGLILYTGYLSSLAQSSQERAQKITGEKAQAVSNQVQVPATQESGDRGAASIRQSQIGERTVSVAPQSAQGEMDSGKKIPSIEDFPSPVHGSILRNVGNYYSESLQDYLFHAGTDYAEAEGTIIRATHGGKVIAIGLDSILGQKVILDCGDGWIVTYGGLDNLRVQDGETLVTQQVLGQVGFFPGAEGRSAQPQLHYEIWHGNEVQRPK